MRPRTSLLDASTFAIITRTPSKLFPAIGVVASRLTTTRVDNSAMSCHRCHVVRLRAASAPTMVNNSVSGCVRDRFSRVSIVNVGPCRRTSSSPAISPGIPAIAARVISKRSIADSTLPSLVFCHGSPATINVTRSRPSACLTLRAATT